MSETPTPTTPTKSWTIDLASHTGPDPVRLALRRGETWQLRCRVLQGGAPAALAGTSPALYWRAPSETGWHQKAAALDPSDPSVLAAALGPADDPGSNAVLFHFQFTSGGLCYAAWGRIDILPSPGAVPNQIPVPQSVLDFAPLEVRNAPYWTQSEADSRYPSVGEPTVYTLVTIVDNNEDSALRILAHAHAIVLTRDASSDDPQEHTLTLPLATGTLALTSQLPDITGKQDTLSAAQLAAANSGATAQKVQKWDGYGSGKADAAALRYRIISQSIDTELSIPSACFPLVVTIDGQQHTFNSAFGSDVETEEYTLDLTQAEGDDSRVPGGYYLLLEGVNWIAAFDSDGSYASVYGSNGLTVQWASEPYVVAAHSARLADRAVQLIDLSVSSLTLLMPSAASGYARDMYVCVSNTSGASASIELAGLGTDYAVRVPDGDDLADILTLAASARCDLYITETPEVHSGLPVLKIVRQDLSSPATALSA